MNIMSEKDNMDPEVLSLLKELGATDRSDTRKKLAEISKVREYIFDLPSYFSSGWLSLDEQELIIRGVCYLEYGNGRVPPDACNFQFGSTTVIPKLLEHFKKGAELDRTDDLTNWLLTQRANTYIPFGKEVPFGINTLEDYYTYEEKRKEKQRQKLEHDQEISRVAKKRRAEISRQHVERSLLNKLRRKHD
ncbi:MAG: hypothetical protein UU67_C0042G0012 [Candidatus Daviesbacteria bacterium GW2011_GWB1_41_5]|uniref:Uncharacterized protein n=2 Tax=Patescibacteria group TaxID=1783273 RepID=A0A0G0YSY0_9BACT|nr:MAG: hypothetical protein UU67_C0042G0012 [Candidatus Daviesbacteria bacterium GW2011_GWB1_41_5]OHB05491.1 MAG: hypothetical protein A3A26_01570 [Candidatus Zambryskibacteria bacterium RIFCSPLOWO2_01_FULL_47_14]